MKKFFSFIAAAFLMATVVSCGNKAATESTDSVDSVDVVVDTTAVDEPVADTLAVDTAAPATETEVTE